MRAIVEYTLEFVIRTPNSLSQKRDDERVIENLPGMLKAVEEDLRGLLPAGWEVTISQEEPERLPGGRVF